MNVIGRAISQAIKEDKWLKIKYRNKEKEETYYWIYVYDIKPKTQKLSVFMFNDKLSLNTIYTIIDFKNILSAEVINLTCGSKNNNKLIEKIESNPVEFSFLEYDKFSINTLYYLRKCYLNDSDPYVKRSFLIDGIDLSILKKQKYIKLNETQEKQVISLIYEEEINDKKNFNKNLCVSLLSIDQGKKSYIVFYNTVRYNPKTKTLKLDDKELLFNHSFLYEGAKSSIYDYLDISIQDFTNMAKEDFNKAVSYLSERIVNGELISTRPVFYVQEQNVIIQFDDLFMYIEDCYKKKALEAPMKSFFGLMNAHSYVRTKEPSVCLLNKEINIDQMRVIYNSLKYPVTYVQGPPGTGKTKTIINVIFSILLNNKTTLISSSNNRPVDSISEALKFTYKNKRYKLPFLRLGNYGDTIKAIKKIREIFNEIDANPQYYINKFNLDFVSQVKDTNDKNNKLLVEKIKLYERKIQLEDVYSNINKILSEMNNHNFSYARLEQKAKEVKQEIDSIPLVTNEEIVKLFYTVDASESLQEFFYNKRLSCFANLKKTDFIELRRIAFSDDLDLAYKDFIHYLSDDSKLKSLLNVFPIILDTNLSSVRIGSAKTRFDLVIMDESGQCNITTALFPISKARNLLLVGDPNQLRPVILLDDGANEEYMKQFHVQKSYDYCKYSILDCMRLNDNVSKYILLRYHYRCGKKIINFSNKRYYHSSLLTNFVQNDGELIFIDSNNNNILDRNACYEEAKGIVDYTKQNNLDDAMIITPFVNQKNLIYKLLDRENLTKKISVGTIHSLQGSEKNTIIFSLAISPKTSRKTYEWLKNNSEVINVGVTRAKKKLIIACDDKALNALSNKDDDLYYLVNYVKKKGDSSFTIPPSPKVSFGKSNDSYFEDEFYKTISHFCSVNRNFKVKRNVAFSEVFADDPNLRKSLQEFDCVIYQTKLFKTIPSIAIEINGGEHFGDARREALDKRKMDVCEKKGIKLIYIPNSFVKAYEEIKFIILQISKNNKNYEQLTLFD